MTKEYDIERSGAGLDIDELECLLGKVLSEGAEKTAALTLERDEARAQRDKAEAMFREVHTQRDQARAALRQCVLALSEPAQRAPNWPRNARNAYTEGCRVLGIKAVVIKRGA